MSVTIPSHRIRPLQRLGNISPYLFAFGVLIFIGWSVWLVFLYPDDGIRGMTPTGIINEVDGFGPSHELLQVGDKIKSVDGIPLEEALPFYENTRPGDLVTFIVDRDNNFISVIIRLARPTSYEFFSRFISLFFALIFWIVGIGVLAFTPVGESIYLYLAFFFCISIFLTSGQISNIGPSWTSELYNFLFWILGPLSVHFHLHFPQSTSFRGKTLLLYGLYAIGVVGGGLYLARGGYPGRTTDWLRLVITGSRLFLTVNLLSVVGILIFVYRNTISLGVKGKIRLVVLGGMMSALPLVTLTFLPEALLHQPIQPYEFAFLWLGILPLTYGYAIFRFHLIEVERHINRTATFILVFSILGGFYLSLYFLLHQIIPIAYENEPFINTILVLILASIFVPIYRQVKKVVDTMFYGGWYDYRSAITQITQGLEQITELRPLAEIVSERLVKTLRLEDTCVFFCDSRGDFSVIDVAPRDRIKEQAEVLFPVLPRSSLDYLLKVGEAERASLAKALSEITLSPEEQELLNSEQIHLWIPIIGHKEVKGLLALGLKYGGDIFSAEDLDILRVVARQIGTLIENIHLLNQLREHAAELEIRVQERTAELHDAKERVEAILANVGDGVIVTNLDGNIITVNKALEKQSGYCSSELIGKNMEYLLAEENDHLLLEKMRHALNKGDVWTGELINRQKNGSKYDIQLTIAPVRDQSGQMVSFVGSQRDITHQKELDRLKDIFVADVSHELRTPTTNINLYLELLESAPAEKHFEYIGVVKDQAQLLRKLVEDILDLSRLAVGRSRKKELSPVDINLLAEQVVTAVNPMAEASGLRMVFLPEDHLPSVRGEQNQLARVITNLVTNAVHYTNEGEVCVRTYSDNGQVFLEVCDTGIGIEEDDLPHIFERFYRGKRVRQTKIHGTGLGLAIVKEIVEYHDGKIQVFSEYGEGSKFVISLPAYQAG